MTDRTTRRIGRAALVGALTSGDSPTKRDARRLQSTSMRILPRDYQVLVMVSKFKQLTTPQIKALVFSETKSRIPTDRAIKRLKQAELIEPIEQRHLGGIRGGSSVSVYQLGREGWPIFFKEKRRIQKVLNYHSLAIATAFVQLKEAEQAGWIHVLNWATEPDSHEDVAGALLKPDLYVDFVVRDKSERYRLWLEIDLGSERQKQVSDQLDIYKYVYDNAEAPQFDVNEKGDVLVPQPLFLVMTDERHRDLDRIIRRARDLEAGWVSVASLDQFPDIFR